MAKKNALPILHLDAHKPSECGKVHGEELRDKIKEIAEIRWEFMRRETSLRSDAQLIELALEHAPVLKAFDKPLYQEIKGIAKGSNQKLERILVLNHYTDMRDINSKVNQKAPKLGEHEDDPGGCSVIYVADEHRPVLGQTWDIHASALPYVTILAIKQKLDSDAKEVAGDGEAKVLLFSIAGCVGMTGMSNKGVAVTINNLSSFDARVGVVWPALVRKILRQTNAKNGRDVVLDATLGSGHHYVIADESNIFAIETSGTQKKVTHEDAAEHHIHTNHCLDVEMAKTHGIRPGSTTYARYQTLKEIMQKHDTLTPSEMFKQFAKVSLPVPKAAHGTATCGAFIMDIANKKILACIGPPSHNKPIALEF